ncbi:MAG: winged helix-turn-helix transcriptional regulator [Thermoleophilia bacterium]|nr:winged helix-turn-helix transcriptional regulator [Thermoleophilia bacterium]
MALPEPLPDELVELIARRFRVIGEPMRIRILTHLRDTELSVSELVELTEASQQNVSKHLGVLLDAGIVARRKVANQSRYRIVDDTVFRLCDEVCGTLQRQLGELNQLLEEATR